MRNILTVSIVLFLLGSNIVNAKNNKITTINEALGAICGTDLQLGLQVFGIRDKGKSQAFQEKAMATFTNPRQKRIMGFSINDAYAYKNLPKKTYALYRMEACYQQMSGKNIPQALPKKMVESLIKCSSIQSQKEQYSCIGKIAHKYSN